MKKEVVSSIHEIYKNCTSIEELNESYKKLAYQYHPFLQGGGNEYMMSRTDFWYNYRLKELLISNLPPHRTVEEVINITEEFKKRVAICIIFK